MKSRLLYTVGALVIPTGVCLLLPGCGGDGSTTSMHSGGGSGAGYAYISTSSPQSAQTPGTVYEYRVGSDGSLSTLSTISVPAGPNPRSIVSDPGGRYVYVVNGDNTISQFSVGAGGELSALSPAIVNITVPPSYSSALSAATVNAGGQFLYVVVQASSLPLPAADVAQYAIGAGGQLTPLAPAYITAPVGASSSLAIDSGGKHAYLGGTAPGLPGPGGVVAQFSIAADGTLAPLATVATPTDGAVALVGSSAYLLSSCIDTACDGQVAQYSVQSDGTLASTGAATTLGSHVIPITLIADAPGAAAYLLTNLMGVDTNQGAVYQYAINSMGGLAPDSPPSLSVASGSVAQGILGSNLHVLSANAIGFASGAPMGGHVDHYTIGADGLLTFVSTSSVAAGGFPTAMTLVTAH